MAIFLEQKDTKLGNLTTFGVGDRVKVSLKIKEGGKERTQVFEGFVIAIKGKGLDRTFTVRRVGAQNVGIERIFQLASPFLESVVVLKKGTRGVRRSKLYYTREKSPREIENIYSRASRREKAKLESANKKKK